MKKEMIRLLSVGAALTLLLSACSSAQSGSNTMSDPPSSEAARADGSLAGEARLETEKGTECPEGNSPPSGAGTQDNTPSLAEALPVSQDSPLQPDMEQPTASPPPAERPDESPELEEDTEEKMTLQIGDSSFTATMEQNAAADAFADMMREAPVVIQMSDYSGFEKVGSLGTTLPASDSQTTTQPGDIVLYNGNQIVVFYGSNTWSYTRLGRVDDLSGWEDALGSDEATVTFSLGE